MKTIHRHVICTTHNDEERTWPQLPIKLINDPGSPIVNAGLIFLKDHLNMRRALVSSEQSLDGKLFVALTYLS